MSDSDNELQAAMDEFMRQHKNTKPNATQLSKFAGCKYAEASRFLRGIKNSSQTTSSTRLPQKIKWIPADEPKQSTSSSYSRSKSVAKTTTTLSRKKPKPRSYSSATSLTKTKKKRPCNNYRLDMLGAEFGSCKCGFSRAAHDNPSAWTDDDDDNDNDEEEEQEQEQEQQQEQEVNDYVNIQSYQTQPLQQEVEEPKIEYQQQEENVNINYAKQENNEIEIDGLKDTIQQLQQQVVTMQQEINKLYQEKETLQKKRDDEKNELLETIAEQQEHIDQLEDEIFGKNNNKAKQNDEYIAPVKQEVVNVERVFHEPVQQEEEEPQEKGACDNYRLDMTGEQFGDCKCGFSKAAHSYY